MVLLTASHWVSDSGERIKLPQGLKAYYQYRLQRYNAFSYYDKPYLESHLTVANMIGVSSETIRKSYNPLLKRMGLIETHGSFYNNDVTYIVNPIHKVVGVLINEYLDKGKIAKREYHDKEEFDYNKLKTLNSNKKLADQLQREKDTPMSVIPKNELIELQRIKFRYEKGE